MAVCLSLVPYVILPVAVRELVSLSYCYSCVLTSRVSCFSLCSPTWQLGSCHSLSDFIFFCPRQTKDASDYIFFCPRQIKDALRLFMLNVM